MIAKIMIVVKIIIIAVFILLNFYVLHSEGSWWTWKMDVLMYQCYTFIAQLIEREENS